MTSSTLLVLPETAGVEGGHVLEPVGEAGDLGGLVPRQNSEVVRPHGLPSPLVVRGHHQITIEVVTTLLASPVMALNKYLI